jgi:microcystin-dependent protein
MAAITRRQYKGAAVSTTITAAINNTVTSCTLAATTGWPSSASVPFFVVIDPGTSSEEKCSATIAGSTLTLTRGKDDTSASAHASGAVIYPVFTATEADEANTFASTMTTRGDLLTMSSTPTVTRLGIGTSSYALTSNGTDPVWGQIVAGGIASDAVTTAKIINSAITTDKIADSAVTSAKIADATIVQGDIALTLLKALCPVGSIKAFVGATAPTGWILCDGTAVVSGTHPELYALCTTTPDLRGRFALGKAASGTGSTLLGTGGSTTITEANLPSHTHANTLTNNSVTTNSITSTSHSHGINDGNTYWGENGTPDWTLANGSSISFKRYNEFDRTSDAASADHTHNITSNVTISNGAIGSGTAYNQPFVAVSYIIKHDYV